MQKQSSAVCQTSGIKSDGMEFLGGYKTAYRFRNTGLALYIQPPH
jgi:hypothetical protein